MSSPTTQEGATTNGNGVAGTFFSLTVTGRAASSSIHLDNNQGYLFNPSHATMGGLWGEEDEGGGAGLRWGEEDGGTSVIPWAWMRGRRWH
jgi:hypothetical protein